MTDQRHVVKNNGKQLWSDVHNIDIGHFATSNYDMSTNLRQHWSMTYKHGIPSTANREAFPQPY